MAISFEEHRQRSKNSVLADVAKGVADKVERLLDENAGALGSEKVSALYLHPGPFDERLFGAVCKQLIERYRPKGWSGVTIENITSRGKQTYVTFSLNPPD